MKAILTALTLCATALAAPAQKRGGVSFNWGTDKVRGVNIGGWLVLEPWITPSFFDSVNKGRASGDQIVDEYTLGQKLGNTAALALLRTHWNSWCTWTDFYNIKQAGINVVRIPIGFWAYNTYNAPYTQGSAVYMDAAVDWARSVGLKIVIDLHGAPGSQNGFDNSGQRTSNPQWQSGNTVQQTLDVLKTISQKYAQPSYQDVIIAIETLNEPATFLNQINFNTLKQFNYDAYGNTRMTSNTPVMIEDGFKQPKEWNGVMTWQQGINGVIVDHHEYQVFSNSDNAMTPAQHVQAVCDRASTYSGADKWTIVGEWCGAMTDCATYLNGYGVGARYDGSMSGSTKVGSCANYNDITKWTTQMKTDTRKYIEAQIYTFEKAVQGWIWWNFKAEMAAEWDLLALVKAGVFPAISNGKVQYKYGPYCQ